MQDYKTKPKKEITSSEAFPLQLVLARNQITRTTSRYKVEYSGQKKDFKDGEEAARNGVTGVTSYSASADIDDVFIDDTGYVGSVNVDGNERQYHAGHMLPDALGGSGDSNNVFKQDGGQNTTGKWPSFERSVGSMRKDGDQNANMTYVVDLKGAGASLRYNQDF